MQDPLDYQSSAARRAEERAGREGRSTLTRPVPLWVWVLLFAVVVLYVVFIAMPGGYDQLPR